VRRFNEGGLGSRGHEGPEDRSSGVLRSVRASFLLARVRLGLRSRLRPFPQSRRSTASTPEAQASWGDTEVSKRPMRYVSSEHLVHGRHLLEAWASHKSFKAQDGSPPPYRRRRTPRRSVLPASASATTARHDASARGSDVPVSRGSDSAEPFRGRRRGPHPWRPRVRRGANAGPFTLSRPGHGL